MAEGENGYTPPEARPDTATVNRQAIEAPQNTSGVSSEQHVAGQENNPPNAPESPAEQSPSQESTAANAVSTDENTDQQVPSPDEQRDDEPNTQQQIPENQQEAPPPIDNESARVIADKLLHQKERILRKSTKPLNDDEFKIKAIYEFREGLAENIRYTFNDHGREIPGIPIDLKVSTNEENPREVDINLLKIAHNENGKRIYTCNAIDPNNPNRTIEVKVTADEIVDKYRTAEAESIAKNFTNPGEAALIAWSLSGDPDAPLPPEAQAIVENETNPLKRADRLIREQIAQLEKQLEGKGPHEAIAERQALRYLQFALATDGDMKELARSGALKRIHETDENRKDIAEIQQELQPKADQQREQLTKACKEAGMTDEQIQNLLDTNLNAMLKNKELLATFAKIPNADQMIFGKKFSDEELKNEIAKYLSPEQKKFLENLDWEGIGRGSLIALIVALAAVGVAAVGAGVAGGMTAVTTGQTLAKSFSS